MVTIQLHTTSQKKLEERGKTVLSPSKDTIVFLLFLRFNAPCTCIPSGCCTKEGSPKASEGLTEDHIGTEVVPLFTKVVCFEIKKYQLLDR